jgi:sporulation protein YlmC with PRC-barrel domain
MLRFRKWTVLILLLAVPALLFAQAQSGGTQQGTQGSSAGTEMMSGYMRLQNAIGTPVMDQAGATVGTIQDFVLSSDGSIPYVVISLQGGGTETQQGQMGTQSGTGTTGDTGGTQSQSDTSGTGSADTQTGTASTDTGTASDTTSQADTSGTQAQADTSAQTQQQGTMGDTSSAQAQQGMQATGAMYLVPSDQISYENGQVKLSIGADQISQFQTFDMATGQLPETLGAAQAGGGQLALASKLANATLMGANQEQLGQVQDAMLDLNEKRIEYVAVAPSTVLGLSQALYAIPADAIQQINLDQNQLITNFTLDQFSQSRGFSQDQWPETVEDATSGGATDETSGTTGDASSDTSGSTSESSTEDSTTTTDDSSSSSSSSSGS